MELRYIGGIQTVTVVFPERTINVATGDVVDLSDTEVALLTGHPDWVPVAALADLKRSELVELAELAGVATTGTKTDLIARLTPTIPPVSQED